MKRTLTAALAVLGLALAAAPARAIVIEGYDSSGTFKAVNLSNDDRFIVDSKISEGLEASTKTVTQTAVSSTTATQVLAADSDRMQSLIVNCGTSRLWCGACGMSISTSAATVPIEVAGQLSPDVPASDTSCTQCLAEGAGGRACVWAAKP